MVNTMNRKPTKEEIDYARKIVGFSDNHLFRFVFASNDYESNEILKTLISCIIGRQVLQAHLLNTEPSKDAYKDKGIRLDVLVECKDENGNIEIVDIEIQTYGSLDYISSRAQSYKGKIIASQMCQGDDSYHLHDTYVVMLLEASYFNDLRFVHEFCNMDIESKELLVNNKEHIVFIELDKVKNLDTRKITQWSLFEQIGYLMNFSHDEKKSDIIKVLVEKHEVLQMMANKKESFFKDMGENWDAYREAIARYDYEHKEEIIMEHGISKGIMIGKEEGFVIGKEEGIMESKITHILNMYNKGYTIEDIADCVELSLLDVQNIIDTKCKENLD